MNLSLPRASFAVFTALLLAASIGVSAKEKGPKMRDITDSIYANPILTSFAKMLQASPDTYTFLSSRGPFTVFVPTDSAFAKLPPGELDALLRPENKDRLTAILYYHVINGKRMAMKDLVPLHAMFSCQGNPLTFKLTHTGVFLVEKARVTHADIHCANGNISQIDTVLMPPEMALPPLRAAAVAPVVAPEPAETNAVTSVPADSVNTNNAPMVVPVIGSGAAGVTNAAPAH